MKRSKDLQFFFKERLCEVWIPSYPQEAFTSRLATCINILVNIHPLHLHVVHFQMNRFGSLSCKLFLVQFTFTQLWRKSKSSDSRKEKIFYWYFLLGCCSVLPITGVYLHVCAYSYLRFCVQFWRVQLYVCIYVHPHMRVYFKNNHFCQKRNVKPYLNWLPVAGMYLPLNLN